MDERQPSCLQTQPSAIVMSIETVAADRRIETIWRRTVHAQLMRSSRQRFQSQPRRATVGGNDLIFGVGLLAIGEVDFLARSVQQVGTYREVDSPFLSGHGTIDNSLVLLINAPFLKFPAQQPLCCLILSHHEESTCGHIEAMDDKGLGAVPPLGENAHHTFHIVFTRYRKESSRLVDNRQIAVVVDYPQFMYRPCSQRIARHINTLQHPAENGFAPSATCRIEMAVPPQFATGPDGSDFSADQTKFAEFCAYDADKAKEYYEQAKTELGKDSFTFNMVVDADDAPQKVAQVVKEQLETTLAGFTLNLTVEPKKQRVQDMQDGNFEIGLTRWGPDYADPMTYLGMWVTGNSNNYGLWSDADYDAIIDECTTGDLCTDPEGRWAALYEAEAIVLEQAVIFPLYGQCNAEMISSAVTGVESHPVALNRVYKRAAKNA